MSEVLGRVSVTTDAELLAEAHQFEALVRRVLTVLNKFDLEGLQPGEPNWAPLDEYRFEAESFAQLLEENGSIDAGDIRDVWMNWFGNDASHLSEAETEQLVVALNGCRAANLPPA